MHTLIFDIGKTNKKVFVFDASYTIVYEEANRISEIKDEDGDPCDDLDALIEWITSTLTRLLEIKEYKISSVNFSSFGASFVHINELGKPTLPLYSYLKPLSPAIKQRFFDENGGEEKLSRETASPVLDSLNSGLQLYRLKYEKSLTEKAGYSLHLPQFLSYLVTRKVYSEITSIGCHTMLWHFEKNDYHPWVQQEDLAKRLAPVYPSSQLLDADRKWGQLKAGVGLHDSSSAIIPYLATFRHQFVLISTGTWAISLNPFNEAPLTSWELKKDCLSFLSYRRKQVKASRFFAGNEHDEQEKRIADHFGKRSRYNDTIQFDRNTVDYLTKTFVQDDRSEFESGPTKFAERELTTFESYEQAYHQLMMDIVHLQKLSTDLVLYESDIKKIYVDGGFSKNPLYMNLLAVKYGEMEIYAANVAQASAIGAALALNSGPVPPDIISTHLQRPYVL